MKLKSTYGPILKQVMENKRLAEIEARMNTKMEDAIPAAEPTNTTLSNTMSLVPVGMQNPPPASGNTLATLQQKPSILPKPKWHAPWKLSRVISGHHGWVRCVAVEPGNEWFATGSNDR